MNNTGSEMRSRFTSDVVSRQRRRLLAEPNCQFVNREKFCELLLSNRQLDRCDEAHMFVRGLVEPKSGQRFLIEEEMLF